MFRWSLAADNWTKSLLSTPKDGEIASPFNTKFSLYYLFFIAGIGTDSYRPSQGIEMRDLIRSVPNDFNEYKHLLAGTLLCSKLTNEGHQLSHKLVKESVLSVLTPDGPAFLAPDAVELMNGYSLGGFEEIRDRLSAPPPPNEFLVWYLTEFIQTSCFNFRSWVRDS